MSDIGRYSGFRTTREDIPQTPYAACVFLDNAIHHLWNRDRDGTSSEFHILNEAHNAINRLDWSEKIA